LVALGHANIYTILGQNIDQLGIVREGNHRTASINSGQLQLCSILREPNTFNLALLHSLDELRVPPLVALRELCVYGRVRSDLEQLHGGSDGRVGKTRVREALLRAEGNLGRGGDNIWGSERDNPTTGGHASLAESSARRQRQHTADNGCDGERRL